MEMRRDDFDLAAELRALRPSPRASFADELDARIAAGFPGAGRHGEDLLSRIAEMLRAISPRRLALPAGATALAAIVIATAVIATVQPEHGASPARQFSELGRSAGESASSADAGVSSGPPPVQFSDAPSARPSTDSAGAQGAAGSQAAVERLGSATGPFASKAGHREVERSAEIVLGADPADVGNEAAKVFEAVHVVNGIVLSSSIRDGADGEARAEFELLIPAAKLGDALAAFSRIGEVRSRHEATQDITATTIGVGERLTESRARIDGLLDQLAAADTEAERSATEIELRAERRRKATLRSRLVGLHRRAHLSRVSLRIETGSATAADHSANGSWGINDALDDALRILAIAAGVAVVGLAVVGPLALIALLAWLANHAWVRRRRERALG
jgi:hypothetical protein